MVRFISPLLVALFFNAALANVDDLFKAARMGEINAIEEALSAGTDVNATDILGETALINAIDECQTDAARTLINKGAKVDYLTKLNVTPLIKAAAEGCTEIVRLLLDEKIDVNNVEPSKHFSALLKAVKYNHIDIVELLVANGADISQADKFGNTPIMVAAQLGHADIVELFIQKGADINTKSMIGHTALLFALEYGHSQIARTLLDNGASINDLDPYNNSPLIHAAKRGYDDIIKTLVENGADLNVKTKKDETAAVLAQKGKFDNIVTFLLENGADSTGLVFVDSVALAAELALAELYDTPPGPIGGVAAVQKRLRYPKKAKEAGIEGTVKINVKVDKRGRVRETEILESFDNENCNKAAQRAVRGARWQAAKKDKKSVEAWIEIEIEFKLAE